jgi:hypothetical protein
LPWIPVSNWRRRPSEPGPRAYPRYTTPPGWLGWPVEGEGQEGAQAWWSDPSGSKIITTPHQGGPILVRSFPSLEIVRSVDPPPGEYWDFNASFADNMIVSALKGQEERFAAIAPHGKIADLDQSEAIHLAKWPCGKSRSHKSHSETAGILAPEQPLPAAIS